jgi:hypothetical protein
MPFLKCETCGKDVADSALVWPHCGQDHPEKMFRQLPHEWVYCPKCRVKNSLYANCGACRSCGGPLNERCTRTGRKENGKIMPILPNFGDPFTAR